MSKGSGGEKASGPQPPSSAWARASSSRQRSCVSGAGGRRVATRRPAGSPRRRSRFAPRASAARRRRDRWRRGIGRARRRRGSRGPEMWPAAGRRSPARSVASSPSSGQDPSAAWSSASRSAAFKRAVAILDPSGRDGGRQRRREGHSGQALVAERAFAAVVVPARGLLRARPVVSARASSGTWRPACARLGAVPGRRRRCCGRRSSVSRATSGAPRGSGTPRPLASGVGRRGGFWLARDQAEEMNRQADREHFAPSQASRSVDGHELLEGVLNLLHLDRLGEDDEPVVGGERLPRSSCLWPSKTRATS